MVVASGIIEIEDMNDLQNIVAALKNNRVEINDIDSANILFILERENIGEVKGEIESVKQIAGVKHVHITYYSMEGMDDGTEPGGSEKESSR